MNAKILTILGGLVLGTSLSASATPFTFVSVSAGSNSDSASGSGPLSLSISGVGLEGLGTAGASALADFGSLGVSASGHAAPAPAFPTVVASSVAQFNDLLFIGGPDGPVDLTFSLELEGGCFATDGATAGFLNAACSAVGSLAVPTNGVSVSNTKTAGSVTITWVGNASLPIAGSLQAGGFAWNGSFNADYIDTLHFFVTSTTPGVVITSESGHDYSQSAAAPIATPEPATLALLGTGLIALGRRRIRAKHLKIAAFVASILIASSSYAQSSKKKAPAPPPMNCEQMSAASGGTVTVATCQQMMGAQQALTAAESDPAASRPGDDKLTCDQIAAEMKQQPITAPDQTKVAETQDSLNDLQKQIDKDKKIGEALVIKETAELSIVNKLPLPNAVQAAEAKRIQAEQKAVNERIKQETAPKVERTFTAFGDLTGDIAKQLTANPRLAKLYQLASDKRCKIQ